MSRERYDYLAKVVFIGDAGVGKTALCRFVTDGYLPPFDEKHDFTVGVEFATKVIATVSGKKLKLQVWDTAGQEAFRSITQSYYRGAVVACLHWDAGKEIRLKHLQSWFEEGKERVSGNAQFIFVRTKIDLDEERGITREKIEEQKQAIREFAGDDAIFVETSAKTEENIKAYLQTIAETALPVCEENALSEPGVSPERRESSEFISGGRSQAAPEIPGRLERMKHSRQVRVEHLAREGLDPVWLKLHLASVETNCSTADMIRNKLNSSLGDQNDNSNDNSPAGDMMLSGDEQAKYAPVLELLGELDSDERALKYKLCIFFTPESYSMRVIAEHDEEVRQRILDVAESLFKLINSDSYDAENFAPTTEQLYGNLTRDDIPSDAREILERTYPSLRPDYVPGLIR